MRKLTTADLMSLEQYAREGSIRWERRPYAGASDLDGVFMVIAATDDTDVNIAVYDDAERCPHCENYITRKDAPSSVPVWVKVTALVCLVVALVHPFWAELYQYRSAPIIIGLVFLLWTTAFYFSQRGRVVLAIVCLTASLGLYQSAINQVQNLVNQYTK